MFVSVVPRARKDLDGFSIAVAITARGKELGVADTVADARRLFASHSVKILPVLDAATYVGAVGREAIADSIPPDAAILPFATARVPTATAATPAVEALAALDREGSSRLVVLGNDQTTYVGLVCLRSDRQRLCVAADCHAEPDPCKPKGSPDE